MANANIASRFILIIGLSGLYINGQVIHQRVPFSTNFVTMVKNTANGVRKSSSTKPKANKEKSQSPTFGKILTNFSKTVLFAACTYILNQHLKISPKKIWIFCFYLLFGHAVGLYRVTSGANTNYISLKIQQFCNNFSLKALTVVRT